MTSFPEPGTRAIPAEELARAPRPTWAIWELTLACDQKCRHCGPRAGRARPDELTTEECLQVVAELKELGVGEVVLIGGESYLRNDFILIIRAIREAGMACVLTTGGYNLSRARVEAMAEAGVMSVTLSVDGLEETHDYLRGMPGSWRRAFQAFAELRAAGLPVACNTQINSRTLTELEPLLEELARAKIHSWQLQLTVAHGNATDHPDLVLQPYRMLELFESIDRILERCRVLGIRMFPANSLGYFGPHEGRLRKDVGGYWRGCVAGVNTIGIESHGAIKNCPSLGGPANVGGSWREHGIAALWTRSYAMTYVRRRTLDDLWGFCRDCYYASTCMAGCTAATESLLGRPGNNPFCHHRALELDREGLRERIEHIAGPSGGARGFDMGRYRLIREHVDPEVRARVGPVQIDEPRASRLETPFGPATPEA
ncbi:MAG: radical SAM protein [Myxococcales bacterium]|nr:radical SAM protein [Myxococcales bacterium]